MNCLCMIVKHNHNCSLCNTLRTCFVFNEFSLLVSICRPCYDKMISAMHDYDIIEDECSFCEKHRTCRVISGFDDSMFFADLNICGACLNRLQSAVDESSHL